jgi:hypothetical protein
MGEPLTKGFVQVGHDGRTIIGGAYTGFISGALNSIEPKILT